MSIQSDRGWVSDELYLGNSLSAALLDLKDISVLPNDRASRVYFYDNFDGRRFFNSTFQNQKPYPEMNFGDINMRLLGLFRLWNAIEYHFPYIDTMDENWNEVLFEFIPQMCAVGVNPQGNRHSYEGALAAIAAKTNDAHVDMRNALFFTNEFGQFIAPVQITRAGGKLVVWDVLSQHSHSVPLLPGDVLLTLDGVSIDDVVAHRMRYIAAPHDNSTKPLRGGSEI